MFKTNGANMYDPATMTRVGRLLYKIKEPVDIFGLVWFSLGNLWVFGAETCGASAPATYKLSLAVIILTYAVILFPILLLLILLPMACFCLPCLIRILVQLSFAFASSCFFTFYAHTHTLCRLLYFFSIRPPLRVMLTLSLSGEKNKNKNCRAVWLGGIRPRPALGSIRARRRARSVRYLHRHSRWACIRRRRPCVQSASWNTKRATR